MPADRLTTSGPADREEKPRDLQAGRLTEDHVLAVLAGSRPEDVAAETQTDVADLVDAVSTYRAAGRAALDVRERRWHQVRIQFTDWQTAETTAADRLWPALRQLEADSTLTGWWFIRKHPYWRLRTIANAGERAQTITALTHLLDDLTAAGLVLRWQESIYEPETLTFGGPYGIDLAHRLFHADSNGFLHHLHHAAADDHPIRRELSLLLCGKLLRTARLDDPEQADVWHRVARLRPLPDEPAVAKLQPMAPAIRRLLTTDIAPTSPLLGISGVLAYTAEWFTAFTETGHRLAAAARDGTLERGLRATLASHVIFHWNRHGLAAGTQAILARAARNALLNPAGTEPTDAPGTR